MLSRFALRHGAGLGRLRRVPLLGALVSRTADALLPRGTRSWVQIQEGGTKGLWMRLNPRVGRDYFLGLVEPRIQQALQQHVRSGGIFYDLGANIGFFSLLGGRLVGPSGRVFSFEADPEIAGRLRENVERNKFSWITVETLAVWSSSVTLPLAHHLAHDSFDRGLSRISMQPTTEKTIQVHSVSLDEYTCSAPPPDFIKCDVEGAEIEVFRGAQNLLAAKRPIVLCELHSPECRAAVLRQLFSLGYTIENLSANHVLALPQ